MEARQILEQFVRTSDHFEESNDESGLTITHRSRPAQGFEAEVNIPSVRAAGMNLMPRIQHIGSWRGVAQCLSGCAGLALVTFLCFQLGFNLATTVCLYLLIIVLLSLQGSFLSSAVVSLLAVGCSAYFFAPPLFSLRVSDPLNMVAITVFFTTSAVVTQLVSRVRKSEEREFHMRLEERVGERTRIARELHDTLLQSFQGA